MHHGRRRRSRQERTKLAEQYRASGESAAAFAAKLGVTAASVVRWAKECESAGVLRRSDKPRLLPVVIGGDPAGGAEQIEVHFADGITVRAPVGMAPAQLGALITAVRQAC